MHAVLVAAATAAALASALAAPAARGAADFFAQGQNVVMLANKTYNLAPRTSLAGSDGDFGALPSPLAAGDCGNALTLDGAEAHTFENGGDAVTAVRLYYRVYRDGTPAPHRLRFRELELERADGQAGNNAGDARWTLPAGSAPRPLGEEGGVDGVGAHRLEVYMEGEVGASGARFYDSGAASQNYVQAFTVAGDAACAALPRGDVLALDDVDGEVRWLEAFACRSADANASVSVALYAGRPGGAAGARLVRAASVAAQQHLSYVLGGAAASSPPYGGAVAALCGGESRHLLRVEWRFREQFPAGGAVDDLYLELRDVAGGSGAPARLVRVSQTLYVPRCADGKGGAEACTQNGDCYAASATRAGNLGAGAATTAAGGGDDARCRCDHYFTGALCDVDARASRVGDDPPLMLSLPVTYRAFTAAHPDMMCCPGSDVELGLVNHALGVDGTPRYNLSAVACANSDCSAASVHTTHGHASFGSWFNNSASSTTYSGQLLELYLSNATTRAYRAEHAQFFPLDDVAPDTFPTVLPGRTFLFTTELHAEFVALPGQTFAFFGDDDVWVFIDDKLRLDIGGTHKAVSRTLELDTLGLTPGTLHSIDVFHAERYCCGSTFRIETSICLDVCPGGPCRQGERPCDTFDTQCVKYQCARPARKRGVSAVRATAASDPGVPVGCYRTVVVGASCAADADDCTRDYCVRNGTCVVGPNQCAATLPDATTQAPIIDRVTGTTAAAAATTAAGGGAGGDSPSGNGGAPSGSGAGGGAPSGNATSRAGARVAPLTLLLAAAAIVVVAAAM